MKKRRTINVPDVERTYIAINSRTGEVLESRDPVNLLSHVLRWWADDDPIGLRAAAVGSAPAERQKNAPLFQQLRSEIARQDKIHPSGYPATRDGVRLALAAAFDEIDEALDEWKLAKRFDSPSWGSTAVEVLQAAAVCMRLLRAIEGAE